MDPVKPLGDRILEASARIAASIDADEWLALLEAEQEQDNR